MAAALLLSTRSAPAQANPATAPPTIRSTANLVLVPTLVESPSGELIETLKASDFRLTDNGVEQKVAIEPIERQPLAVVVLLQTGGAASRQFGYYAKLSTMLDYMMGSSAHRVALLTFDSQPETVTDFTANISSLKDELAHPQPGDGGAAILDAVDAGIDQLKQQPADRRRILILLSQPQDDGSRAHVEEVVRRLGENSVTIYSVTFSPETTWLKDQFTKPRHENRPYQLSPDQPLLLRHLRSRNAARRGPQGDAHQRRRLRRVAVGRRVGKLRRSARSRTPARHPGEPHPEPLHAQLSPDLGSGGVAHARGSYPQPARAADLGAHQLLADGSACPVTKGRRSTSAAG